MFYILIGLATVGLFTCIHMLGKQWHKLKVWHKKQSNEDFHRVKVIRIGE